MNMPKPNEVKYVVESTSEGYSLLYLLLKQTSTEIIECGSGNGLWSDGPQSGLVSLNYTKINGDWYCFYEPTSCLVDWYKVECSIGTMFTKSETVKLTSIYYRSQNKQGEY